MVTGALARGPELAVMDQDGVVSHLPSTPKVEDGCKRELDVFAGVVDKANLPATHQGKKQVKNGVKFKINRLPPNLTPSDIKPSSLARG